MGSPLKECWCQRTLTSRWFHLSWTRNSSDSTSQHKHWFNLGTATTHCSGCSGFTSTSALVRLFSAALNSPPHWYPFHQLLCFTSALVPLSSAAVVSPRHWNHSLLLLWFHLGTGTTLFCCSGFTSALVPLSLADLLPLALALTLVNRSS